MNSNLKIIKNFFKNIYSYKPLLITYVILVILLLIISIKNHEKQELENFENQKFNNKKLVYSNNKKKCAIKFKDEPDKVKVCKKYYKCKKECSTSLKPKNCNKKCKKYKLNLYRDNPVKIEKIKLRDEIKKQQKKDKIEEEYERQQELKKEKKEEKPSKTKIFLIDLINKNLSESEKVFLFDLSSSTSRFYKDFKNIFRY